MVFLVHSVQGFVLYVNNIDVYIYSGRLWWVCMSAKYTSVSGEFNKPLLSLLDLSNFALNSPNNGHINQLI